jgi:hypothetical protein
MPTRRSPLSVNATMDGVVRAPSAFSITFAACRATRRRQGAQHWRTGARANKGSRAPQARGVACLALHDRHAAVGGAQVDADHLAAPGAARGRARRRGRGTSGGRDAGNAPAPPPAGARRGFRAPARGATPRSLPPARRQSRHAASERVATTCLKPRAAWRRKPVSPKAAAGRQWLLALLGVALLGVSSRDADSPRRATRRILAAPPVRHARSCAAPPSAPRVRSPERRRRRRDAQQRRGVRCSQVTQVS